MFDAGQMKSTIQGACDIYVTGAAIQSGVNPDAVRNLHMVEEKWATEIATATQPVLLIADNQAKTIGARSSIIAQAMPNTPIIFESVAGYKQAKQSRFLCAEFARNMHGYCFHDDTGNDINPVFRHSDMIVIIGQTDSKISDIFALHNKKYKKAKINMPLISDKTSEGTINDRQSWMRSCGNMIGRPCVV